VHIFAGGRVDIGMNIHFSRSIVKSGNWPKEARKAFLGIETVVDWALKLAREGKSVRGLNLTDRQKRRFNHLSLNSSSAAAIKAAKEWVLRPKVVYASKPQGQIAEVSYAYCTCRDCPSIWEGTTTDGRAIYARFRFGQLSVCLKGRSEKDGIPAGGETTVLVLRYDDEYAGSLNFAELKKITKGRIKWPETAGEDSL